MNSPMVSIIIPTFNSEEMIARCLQSIKDQTYRNIEVIVVDKYSNDNTLKMAKKFNARVLLMNSERSAARNRGAENAKGSFILFLDSDMELTPKVVEECIAMCLQKGMDAVLVPEVSVVSGGFLSECLKKEIEMFRGKFPGLPKFLRAEVFHSIGGYDENLVFGEDFDLCARTEKAGYKMGGVKVEIMHHEGEVSMKRIILKTYYYGKTLPLFIRKNPSHIMRLYCPIRYLPYFRLLRESPIHFMGLMVMKLVKYMVFLIGVFVYTFSR